MVQQVDGSWRMYFNNDIGLKSWANEITMTAVYETNGVQSKGDPIDFTIMVTDEIVNEDIDFEGSPFGTQCYEWNTLTFKDNKDNVIDSISQRLSLINIEMQALVEDSLGETVELHVISKLAGDTIIVIANKSFDNDTIVRYSVDFEAIYKDLDSSNYIKKSGKLSVEPFDIIKAQWVHPRDPRDAQFSFLDVRIAPEFYFGADTLYADSIPLTLKYFDQQSASMDVELRFLDTVLTPYALNETSRYTYYRQVRLATAFELLDIPEENFKLIAKFTDPVTGIAAWDTAIVIPPKYDLNTNTLEMVLFDKNTDGRMDSIRLSYDDLNDPNLKNSYDFELLWKLDRGDSIGWILVDSSAMTDFSQSIVDDNIQYFLSSTYGFSES